MVFFKNRDKISRGNDSPKRIDPACQPFQRGSLPGFDPHDCLIVDFYPFVFQSFFKCVKYIALRPEFFIVFLCVIYVGLVQIIPDKTQGMFCVIHGAENVCSRFQDADSRLDTFGVSICFEFDFFINGSDFFLDIPVIFIWENQDETIILSPVKEAVRKFFFQYLSCQMEQFITV